MTVLKKQAKKPRKPGSGGRRPGSGRKPGSPNKVTSTVKMMVIEALNKLGGVKFLVKQGKDNPTAMLTLLGKIIPTQVVGDMSYRYVARIPAPEGDSKEWLKKYSTQQLPQSTAKH